MPRKRIAIDFHPVSPWLVVFSRDPQWALQYLHSFILKIYVGYFYFIFFGPPSRQELHLCILHPAPGPGTSAS